MTARLVRSLHALVPLAAMLAVALGLRLGAKSAVRAADVYAAAPARAGTGLAWQIIALEEEHGLRSPIVALALTVAARTDNGVATWQGTTNADGIAEAALALPDPLGQNVDLDVQSGRTSLARGRVDIAVPPPPAAPVSAWMPFAARHGAIALDVAVRGGRAAPGFAASVWVRAREAAGPRHGAPVAGVAIEPERDPSLASTRVRSRTDAAGWAELDVVPVGLAVALRLSATAPDGRTGEWDGGLFMSPGAARLETHTRWAPFESPEIDVTFASRTETAYVEIDDAYGRAWGTTGGAADTSPTASFGMRVHAPPLAPGLYWAVASKDPAGASGLGPGTIAAPFFVAANDEAALALGSDRDECAGATDSRDVSRRLASCLAVTALASTPRRLALDGFVAAHARDGEKRAHGLAIALGAVFTAMILEGALLLRSAALSRARLRAAMVAADDRRSDRALHAASVAIALLLALLGFLLLAAFVARAA